VLEGLRLPIDALDPFADAKLLLAERRWLAELIDARVSTRKPAAYLLNRAYIQGVPFYVDERVIVPRSFIGEVLFAGLLGEGGLVADPGAVTSVLDLCTGGGSLAILAARVFPNAAISASDISADALAVAEKNLAEHGLKDRIRLVESDLFAALGSARYDLILANPPYVEDAAVAAFPREYAAEPKLAHIGGPDGLDIVRRIVGEARAHLNPRGGLLCEIGQGQPAFEASFPNLEVIWLDTEESEGEVFYAKTENLPPARVKRGRAKGPSASG
jgi:ribosomal protein L3 glutamine methyltransferase